MSVHAIEPSTRVTVTGDGTGVTSQAGTHLLGRIATTLGVASGFSDVLASTTSRASAHDRGRVLTQLAMTIAAGGRCLSDLKTLREQPALFGTVASDPTGWRAVHQLDDTLLEELVRVRQDATRRLLEQADVDMLDLKVDATLLNLHSEDKQGAAATFKGTFGFAPMLCFIEPLGLPAGVLRPGNATANNASDQLAVVDQAIGSLPGDWQAGHRDGDDPELVQRRLTVSADTAGGSKTVVEGLADRNLVFKVGMRTSQGAAAVIAGLDEHGWIDAIDTNGKVRDGAQVCEVAALVPDWAPDGTRAIVRRERPHPGAQLRLWDHNGLRHQVTLTNDTEPDIRLIERAHRRHATVENRIKNLKDTGLSRLPFSDYDANRTWVELVQIAALLLAALQQHVDDEELAIAEPRRLRYALLHVAARITRHARRVWLHLDATWPWTGQLLTAHRRLDLAVGVHA